MDWGMSNRLSRMIKPSDGKSVMLACDHGYFMGPTHNLERLAMIYYGLDDIRDIYRTDIDWLRKFPLKF